MRDEGSVNAFQRQVGTLVALGEQATTQVNLLQACLIDEMLKLAHPSLVKPAIVLVLGPINHIKNARKEPWP
jgi:hypothetical protein